MAGSSVDAYSGIENAAHDACIDKRRIDALQASDSHLLPEKQQTVQLTWDLTAEGAVPGLAPVGIFSDHLTFLPIALAEPGYVPSCSMPDNHTQLLRQPVAIVTSSTR